MSSPTPLETPAVQNKRAPGWLTGLRARLLFFSLSVMLPLVALSGYRVWEHNRTANARLTQSVNNATSLIAERVERRVQTTNALLDVLSEAVHFQPGQRVHNDSLLARVLRLGPAAYVNLYAYDTTGTLSGVASYTPRLDSLRPRVLSLLGRLRTAPTLYVGARSRSAVLGDSAFVLIFARGVYRDSTLIGAVAVSVRVDSIAQVVDVPIVIPRTVITLFDTSGAVLARSRDGRTAVPDSSMSRSVFQRIISGEPLFRVSDSGEDRLVSVSRTTAVPWFVSVSIPEAEAMAPLTAEFWRDAFVALIAFLTALVVAYIAGGRIARPLNVLAADAGTIARGVTNHRSRVSDSSEIGVLASAFNHMAETVERRSAALADSERRYRLLFDSNPLPMWAWDADTMQILAVNEAALEHYGYDRDTFLSLRIIDIIDPVDHERFSRSRLPFSESRQRAGTWTHRTADGRKVEMDVITTSSRRLGRASWLSVGIDITARREAERALARSEEQLRQSQKMEAIGAFAGGIAHDFNNLLTGMLGYCDLAMFDAEEDSPLRSDIEEIRKLALRGADLTRQILAVSRKNVVQPTVLDANSIVRGLDRLLARLIGEHIEIVTQLDDTIGLIRADLGQLEQVLLNLAANARDAMPNGGTLQITSRDVPASEVACQTLDQSQQWIAIAVRDSGVGMTEEVKQRVFEPFFTTKERGKGTGLGLALAYGMVEQAGGNIRVESEPGKGSTFTLYFPVAADAMSIPANGDGSTRELHGTETILLAEDEDSVRTVAQSTLQRWGYKVLVANDGASALDIALEYAGRIHLLLTDVVMPGMNGRELAEQVQEARPNIRVLFASGYTDDAALRAGISLDEVPFVQKPFTPRELAERVREALDEPARVA